MTDFDIELQSGAHITAAALIEPDFHTSEFVRIELQRLLRERYGINGEPSIKTFEYRIREV